VVVETVTGVLAGLALVWLVLLALLWLHGGLLDQAGLREALRLLPDLVRLLQGLSRRLGGMLRR
jgi:hypothetical protein